MKFFDTAKTAFRALSSNKVRSALTMLGVIIGVFSVVTLVSLGIGVQNYITDQFNALGTNLIYVMPGKINFQSDPAEAMTNNKLREKHVDLVRMYSGEHVTSVTPWIVSGQTVTYKNKNFYSSIIGGDEGIGEMFDIKLTEGRHFDRSDVRAKRKVAIIGPLVSEELFPNTSPIGKKVKIRDHYYEVIGVAAKKSRDFDDQATIPYTSLRETLNLEVLTGIAIKVNSSDNISLAMREVKHALLRDLKEDDFTVMSQSDLLSSIQNILGILTLAIGAIAAISLVVGGIGIMNIMLVSVTERTREIGLRKAVGATPKNIALQFLTESTLLSVFGGVIGLILGLLGANVIRELANIRAEVPWWTVFVAFGFSVLVGVTFGTHPAIKASKKDPIEALRYE